MALKAWLALLKTAVTAVTAVQAPVYAGLPCNVAEKQTLQALLSAAA